MAHIRNYFLDSVKPTGANETMETLWGEGKADPKDVLESNGFLMRKIALNSSQAGGRRGRGRRNRGKSGEKKGEISMKTGRSGIISCVPNRGN